jgi:hypothetical protein
LLGTGRTGAEGYHYRPKCALQVWQMTSRRTINGVLFNFLGTYTSRYSDYKGYWLFGFLVSCPEQRFVINLLLPPDESNQPDTLVVAVRLAAQKFAEQIAKAGFQLSHFRSAHLEIAHSSVLRSSLVNGHLRAGYDLSFRVTAVSDDDKTYHSETSVFVAPHDPTVEFRSARDAGSDQGLSMVSSCFPMLRKR